MCVVPWRIAFSRVRVARVHVLRRKRRLSLGRFANCLFKIATRRVATIEDAGFVEMNMSFNESRGDEPAARVDHRSDGCDIRFDRRYLSA